MLVLTLLGAVRPIGRMPNTRTRYELDRTALALEYGKRILTGTN